MESMNALERLNLLEKKISALIDMLTSQKELNAKLLKENEELKNTLLKGSQQVDDVKQEQVLTKMVVDELISSIDRLVDIKHEEL